jgi:hypothetical protein
MIRLLSGVCGLFWFGVGVFLLLSSIILLSLFIYPCAAGQALCDNIGTLLVQNLFFGRLPDGLVTSLGRLLAGSLTIYSLLTLLMARLLVGFAAQLRPSQVPTFHAVFCAATVILLVMLALLPVQVAPWLQWVDQACPVDDGSSLCPATNESRELVSVYQNVLRGTGWLSGLLAVGVGLSGFWLFAASKNFAPHPARRSIGKLACQFCAFQPGTQAETVCQLCDLNFRLTLDFEKKDDTEGNLAIKLQPTYQDVPYQQPTLDISLPAAIEVIMDEMSQDHHRIVSQERAGRNNLIRLQGVGFSTTSTDVKLLLRNTAKTWRDKAMVRVNSAALIRKDDEPYLRKYEAQQDLGASVKG